MKPPNELTVARTPVKDCSACAIGRRHNQIDWTNHPFAGHGMTAEGGWSHPELGRKK